MKVSRVISGVLTVAVVSGSIAAAYYRQEISDWLELRSYEPTAEIAQLAVDSKLNDEGTRLFYLQDPELLTKENFAGKCSTSEETIVLGCYITDTKIYVFDVDDERLEGVEEVTAAHEMLHAAYDRLSDEERNRIDAITDEFYANTSDERLIKSIESYRSRDPSVVPNELHSILGTEIREIPQELEQYYSQYFTNRSDLVSIAEAYENEFTKLEERIDKLDSELDSLESEIRAQEAIKLVEALHRRQARELKNSEESAAA